MILLPGLIVIASNFSGDELGLTAKNVAVHTQAQIPWSIHHVFWRAKDGNALIDLIDVLLVVAIGFAIIMMALPAAYGGLGLRK